MSIGKTVRRMGRQHFDVIRREGFYENGRYELDASTPIPARGNVQPATAQDIQQLPEASRAQGAISIWGAFRRDNRERLELQTTGLGRDDDDVGNKVADRIVYCDLEYEVQTIARWPGHTRYVCTRAQQ